MGWGVLRWRIWGLGLERVGSNRVRRGVGSEMGNGVGSITVEDTVSGVGKGRE